MEAQQIDTRECTQPKKRIACKGSLSAEQLFAIAQLSCEGCKHFNKTGEHINHDCWRNKYVRAAYTGIWY